MTLRTALASLSFLKVAVLSLLIGTTVVATVAVERMLYLSRANETQLGLRIADTVELFEEQQEFLSILGRRGYQRRDSVQFATRCRRELALFAHDPQIRSLAPLLVAEAAHRLGQMQMLAGRRAEALEQLELSTGLAQAGNDVRRIGLANNTYGVLLAELGRRDEAENRFEIAVEHLEQIPAEREIYALALRNLGILRSNKGTVDLRSLELSADAVLLRKGESRFCPATEILIDGRVAIANGLLTVGAPEEALRELVLAQQEVRYLLTRTVDSSHESHVVSYRRLEAAKDLLGSHIEQLQTYIAHSDVDIPPTCLRWNVLFELHTEMIDANAHSEFLMSAEFESQTGIAVPWTEYRWIKQASLEIVQAVFKNLDVVVVVVDEDDYYDALQELQKVDLPIDKLQFAFAPIDTPWLRDNGPIAGKLLHDHSAAWVDSHVLTAGMMQRVEEDALPRVLAKNWPIHRLETGLSIQGGEILTNGQGLLVCSEQLIARNRSCGFDRQSLNVELERATGANQVLALECLDGEPTQHLDIFMTFVNHNTVVVGNYLDKNHPGAKLLDSNARKLAGVILEDGSQLNVVRIPMPAQRSGNFPNYTNVVYANGVLLVPSWQFASQKLEDEARQIYQGLLPDWEIVMIDCTQLAPTGGALHCLTTNLGNAPLGERTADTVSTPGS